MFSSIWPIDRTLSGATTSGQSGPGRDDKELFHIPQSSSITGASQSDCLVLYPGHLLGGGEVGLTPLQQCNRYILHPFDWSSLFYLTHRQDPIRCYHSRSEWTWEQWQWMSTPHSPKLQGWSLVIRLFNVISRNSLSGEVLPLSTDAVGAFNSLSQLGWV